MLCVGGFEGLVCWLMIGVVWVLIVGCLLWLVCEVWVWLVIWWYVYVGISDRLLEIKRGLSLLPSFINLTQLIKNTCKTYSNNRSNTNTTNNIVSRSIYNPKHYIDESPNPERRPLESFHKVIVALGVKRVASLP